MCLISWERTPKRDPHKHFRADFWGQKWAPNGPFSTTTKFSLLFFPALILTCFHASFFPFCPLCWPPLFLSFSGTFSPCSPPRKVLCSVEQRAQHTAWRGAVSGWTSPESSGRKFLPEICVKKGQYFPLLRNGPSTLVFQDISQGYFRIPSGAPGLHALLNYFGINFRFDYTYTYTSNCFVN